MSAAVVRWPDGTVDVAETWGDLLRHVGSDRWTRSSKLAAKRALRRRALRWSNTLVRSEGVTAREFFVELERAGMLVILDETGEPANAGKERDGQ